MPSTVLGKFRVPVLRHLCSTNAPAAWAWSQWLQPYQNRLNRHPFLWRRSLEHPFIKQAISPSTLHTCSPQVSLLLGQMPCPSFVLQVPLSCDALLLRHRWDIFPSFRGKKEYIFKVFLLLLYYPFLLPLVLNWFPVTMLVTLIIYSHT